MISGNPTPLLHRWMCEIVLFMTKQSFTAKVSLEMPMTAWWCRSVPYMILVPLQMLENPASDFRLGSLLDMDILK